MSRHDRHARASADRTNLYDDITNKIIAELEQGRLPWVQPWGTAAAIRAYAPTDTELHRIADTLQAVQRRNFYQLRATLTHRGRYYHEHCMAIAVDRDSPVGQDMTADAEDAVSEALRDLARWLYRQLEREYEHLTSDEVVDEAIAANGYTFTEAGRRFG